jgi:hypothetical protein
MTRVVLVPGALALLPEYAGLDDPVRDLRAACLSAVAWLGRDVEVLADDQGARVGAYLVDATTRSVDEPSYLVVANGSARRTEKAPGHLDERSFAFDDGLREWLFGRGPLPDAALGAELLASMTGFALMAERVAPWGQPVVDFDDDPFGVQYWVLRWQVR